jgi:hypothetical protein
MLIKCAFVGQKTLIFIEMHGTTTTKNSNIKFHENLPRERRVVLCGRKDRHEVTCRNFATAPKEYTPSAHRMMRFSTSPIFAHSLRISTLATETEASTPIHGPTPTTGRCVLAHVTDGLPTKTSLNTTTQMAANTTIFINRKIVAGTLYH